MDRVGMDVLATSEEPPPSRVACGPLERGRWFASTLLVCCLAWWFAYDLAPATAGGALAAGPEAVPSACFVALADNDTARIVQPVRPASGFEHLAVPAVAAVSVATCLRRPQNSLLPTVVLAFLAVCFGAAELVVASSPSVALADHGADSWHSQIPLVVGLVTSSVAVLASLLVAQGKGKAVIWQRTGRGVKGGSEGKKVVTCVDTSCQACVEAVGWRRAKRSDDARVRAGGDEAEGAVKEHGGEAFVVSFVQTTHAAHCRAGQAVTLEDLAKYPRVQKLVMRASSQEEISEAIRLSVGRTLSASEVSRVAEKVRELLKTRRIDEYREVVPLLSELAKMNPTFGAALTVKASSGPVTINYGVFKGSNEPLPPSFNALDGARLSSVLVLWPWATDVEALGPPITAADAMHTKCKQGYLANVSMRVAKRNVSLLTIWVGSEDADAWRTVLSRAKTHLKIQLQPGTSVITDRGTALLRAVDDVLEGVQSLFCRPHLSRNVVHNFPELKRLGEKLKKVLDNVFYARTHQDLDTALKQIDIEWDRVKPRGESAGAGGDAPSGAGAVGPASGSGAAADPADDDSESDDEDDPLTANTKPRTVIKREDNEKPSEYVKRIGLDKFCVACMRAPNGDVPSNNAAEAQGSWFLRDIRFLSPARAIIAIFRAHALCFYNAVADLKKHKEHGELLYPCWPFHEKFKEELARVEDYQVKRLSDSEYTVTYVGAARGDEFTTSHVVRLDFDVPVDESKPWSVTPRRGHSCNAGCYVPQVRRAVCPHMMAALRMRYPGSWAKQDKLGDAQLEAKRTEDANVYRTALRSVVALYYQVDYLLDRMQPLVALGKFFIPSIEDLVVGPRLNPIFPIPDLLAKYQAANGGRPVAEARVRSNGEPEMVEAAGQRKRACLGKKYTCRVCRSHGETGEGHTKRSALCPHNGKAASGAAALGESAAAAAPTSATPASAGASSGVGIRMDTSDASDASDAETDVSG